MDKIDASAGLRFSLLLFQRYKQNGMLEAELPSAPRMQGKCTASIKLTDGKVEMCVLQDRKGKRVQVDIETLCRWDDEKGPFHWVLLTPIIREAAPVEAPPVDIPRRVSELHPQMFYGWTIQQKQMLFHVYTIIDGSKSVNDIKRLSSLPPETVDEILNLLLRWRIIQY